jgi:hypothetical protein
MTLQEIIRERNKTLPPEQQLFEHGTRPQYRIGVYAWHPASDIYFAREDEATEFVRSYNPELHNDRNLRKT